MKETQTRTAAVLWSGGKDCALALREARRGGWSIRCLATFVPPDATFRAHPLDVMRRQAEAMGLEHVCIEIREPFDAAYHAGIERLRAERGVAALVTGDIAEVDGRPNWIRQCAAGTGVEVLTPLWHAPRETLLARLIGEGFVAMISAVRGPALTAEWLGRILDETAVTELRRLNAAHGLDPCGENGEFHTIVLDGPGFARRLTVADARPHRQGDLTYLEFGRVELEAGEPQAGTRK